MLIRENLTARWGDLTLTTFKSRITEGSLKRIVTPRISRS